MSLTFFATLLMNGLVEGLIVALAALAITLVYAESRFMNASVGDLMTTSAYVVIGGQKLLGLGLAASVAGSVLLSPIISLLLWALVFIRLEKASRTACLLASLGLAFFIRGVLTFFVGFDQHVIDAPLMQGINIWGILVAPMDIALAAVAAITISLVFAVLTWSPVGRRMRAVADDIDLARASGINVRMVNITLWLMLGLLAAVGGIVLGVKTVVYSEMGWEILLPGFAAAILGGLGNPVGAVAGGLLLGIAQEVSSPLVGSVYKISVSFVVLFVALMLRPNGLLGKAVGVR